MQEKCHFFSYFAIFFGLSGAILQKNIYECIFFPFMEKSFSRKRFSRGYALDSSDDYAGRTSFEPSS